MTAQANDVRVVVHGNKVDIDVFFRSKSVSDSLAVLKVLVPKAQAIADLEPEHLCPIHNVAMKRREADGDTWYSHRLEDKSYCRGVEKPKEEESK